MPMVLPGSCISGIVLWQTMIPETTLRAFWLEAFSSGFTFTLTQECQRGGSGGQAPLLPFSTRARGQECPFNGTIYFVNDA